MTMMVWLWLTKTDYIDEHMKKNWPRKFSHSSVVNKVFYHLRGFEGGEEQKFFPLYFSVYISLYTYAIYLLFRTLRKKNNFYSNTFFRQPLISKIFMMFLIIVYIAELNVLYIYYCKVCGKSGFFVINA